MRPTDVIVSWKAWRYFCKLASFVPTSIIRPWSNCCEVLCSLVCSCRSIMPIMKKYRPNRKQLKTTLRMYTAFSYSLFNFLKGNMRMGNHFSRVCLSVCLSDCSDYRPGATVRSIWSFERVSEEYKHVEVKVR